MSINVGIIGCGGITAFNHVPQLLMYDKEIYIKYLCDSNINRAQILKQAYELDYSSCVDKYNLILDDNDIDAVIVAAWPTNNLTISTEAIKKNKHVLMQKPFIASNDAKAEFVALIDNSNLQILPLPYIESLEPFKKLKNIIQSNALGEINYARIRTTISNPADYYNDVRKFFVENSNIIPYENHWYANGRGSLSDMGPYALSAYYYLFGEGELLNFHIHPGKYDQVALLSLKSHSTIALCSIEIGWNQIRGSELCSIYGSEGTVYMESNGNIKINHKKGKIESIPFILNNTKVTMLPISPFDAQNLWLDAIYDTPLPKKMEIINRAVWVSNIIDYIYENI